MAGAWLVLGRRQVRCADCIHWQEDSPEGECHRYPPQHVYLGKMRMVWPETPPDAWCGEFKAYAEEEEGGGDGPVVETL
jgi:hypothetical protein